MFFFPDHVCVPLFLCEFICTYLGPGPHNATGSCVLSGVYVDTPVLPVRRHSPCPAGRAELGQRMGQIG